MLVGVLEDCGHELRAGTEEAGAGGEVRTWANYDFIFDGVCSASGGLVGYGGGS